MLKGGQEQGGGFPVHKAFAILETIARSDHPLGVSELSVLLSIPKPTAHRILRSMESHGLLQREPGARGYQLGPRLFNFGLDIVASLVRVAPRHAILEALSREIGETCNFGVMTGSHVVYLDRVEAAWPLGLRFEPGSQVPLHCTAMGKLFLSFMTVGQRERFLNATPLHAYTENTITDPLQIELNLTQIREDEVSIDNQEFLAGVVCVAVPVRGPGGDIAASIAVSAPAARMSLTRAAQCIPLLRAAAARMGEAICEASDAPTPAKTTKRKTK